MNNISIETKYKDALKVLEQAFNKQDYELLSKSSELFLDVLNLNDEHINSYFCLAYISFILNNYTFAKSFLIKILELEPFNSKAQKMLKDIPSQENPNPNINNTIKESFLKNIKDTKI